MATLITNGALLRLMQLSSMSLPVGAYAFSQGLEYAVDIGWVNNKQDAREWLQLQLNHSLARVDLPMVFRLYSALAQDERALVNDCNHFLLACRETHELRLTDTAMGLALRRLLVAQDIDVMLASEEAPSFVTMFAIAARHWRIEVRHCALGLAWSWLENQVAAATKLIPLGQTAAQALLGELQSDIPAALDQAQSLPEDEWGASLPGLVMASALHETQHTRLFRS